MHISELFNEEALREEIRLGYVSERHHKTLPLKIYNYTPSAQYDRRWNEVTLQCRGLIVNEVGTVIARPFEKIFNYEEVKGNLDVSGPVSVTDKLDGSLGICFLYGGEYHVATRGSFHSEQAEWATAYLRDRSDYKRAVYQLQENGLTPLVEIIYPENRIVVDYGDQSGLVLLGARNHNNFKSDISPGAIKILYSWPGEIAEDFKCERFSDALLLPNRENAEGIVVHFAKTGTRVKIKQEDYVRLHKTIFSLTKKTIWQNLSDGLFISDIIKDLPDELHLLVKQYADELVEEFNVVLDHINAEYTKLYQIANGKTRKEWAEIMKDHKYKSFFWTILDGHDDKLEKSIWKAIKPKG